MAKTKVAAEGSITKCSRVKKGVQVTFKELFFAPGQVEQLGEWIDEGRKVRVTVEATEEFLGEKKPDPRPDETAKD